MIDLGFPGGSRLADRVAPNARAEGALLFSKPIWNHVFMVGGRIIYFRDPLDAALAAPGNCRFVRRPSAAPAHCMNGRTWIGGVSRLLTIAYFPLRPASW